MKKGRAGVNRLELDIAPAAEALVCVAVAAVPSLVIPFGENPFEPHKAAFLWAATSAGAAALIASPEQLSRLIRERPWTKRLAIAVGCSLVSIAVSSILSPAPALAWWGSGVRRFGALTEIALPCLMVIVAALAADPARFGRIVTAAVLGSVAPTLYGMAQWLGVDPLNLDARLFERPSGTFGNPLWLSGYLVAVMPLSVGYAATSSEPLRRRAGAMLVGLQAIAVVAARSRGPILAVSVAAAVVGAAMLATTGRRRAASAVAVTIAVAAAAAVIMSSLWATPGPGAGASAVRDDDRGRATIVVRALLWRAAGTGVSAGAWRAVFGSGPESMPRVLTAYAAVSDASLEAPNEIPDRAHNDTLDRAVMFGAAGLSTRLVTLYVALGAAFAALGLLQRSEWPRFALGAAGVTVVAVAAGWLLGGAWTLAISAPAAVIAFACGWIARRDQDRSPAHDRVLWALAATACWIAHFIDIQISIASIASATAASVALALTAAGADQPTGLPVGALAAPKRHRAATSDALPVLVGVCSALMLVALTTPVAGATAGALTLTAITLLLGNALVAADRRGIAVSTLVLIASTLIWLPFGNAGATLDIQGGALAGRIVILAALLAASSLILTWRLAQPPIRGRTILVLMLAEGIALAFVGRGALRRSMADVLLGAGRACEARGDVFCADAEYERGVAADPSDTRAHTRVARVLLTRADSGSTPQQRDELFAQAAAHLALASTADPFDYHHPRNEASLERRWAGQLPARDRAPHFERADAAYVAAVARAPSVGPLWVEWANLRLEQRRIDEALDKLEHAVTLGRAGDATLVCDALLPALGIDIHSADGVAAAAAALRARGLVRLSELYAVRAAGAPVR